ncbi:hypothetical protein VARIO8X_110105 [Burkholderiales bacterium 8X]|nr:hypothetical protein VARIO8X_110105 [Burkholderiales bacterium 8X]
MASLSATAAERTLDAAKRTAGQGPEATKSKVSIL